MIFVTVGEQLPFDRLIKAVDDFAPQLPDKVFAQIGNTKWKPRNIDYAWFLDPLSYEAKFREAELIVAHAGMGTIITALELSKRLIAMPRQAIYREHRNDHQLATAERFAKLGYIHVVRDEGELREFLLSPYDLKTGKMQKSKAYLSSSLLTAISDFVAKV